MSQAKRLLLFKAMSRTFPDMNGKRVGLTICARACNNIKIICDVGAIPERPQRTTMDTRFPNVHRRVPASPPRGTRQQGMAEHANRKWRNTPTTTTLFLSEFGIPMCSRGVSNPTFLTEFVGHHGAQSGNRGIQPSLALSKLGGASTSVTMGRKVGFQSNLPYRIWEGSEDLGCLER